MAFAGMVRRGADMQMAAMAQRRRAEMARRRNEAARRRMETRRMPLDRGAGYRESMERRGKILSALRRTPPVGRVSEKRKAEMLSAVERMPWARASPIGRMRVRPNVRLTKFQMEKIAAITGRFASAKNGR
ncbi:hypothetical protein HY095_03175 [Candidatus Micrarchaeota archaeon]|nr:hypothetical protein [Candidatus Micrarchaeota archaeon]